MSRRNTLHPLSRSTSVAASGDSCAETTGNGCQNSLTIFSRGAAMLAEATTIQKARELKSLALTAADWARRKGLGEEAIAHARRYALQAERKMGEMLRQTERAKGRLKHVIAVPTGYSDAPTLPQLGLSRKESAAAQELAALPQDKFEALLAGEVTRAELRHEYRTKLRLETQRAGHNRATGVAQIVSADALEFLNSQPASSTDLLLTDPPYSTEVEDIDTFAKTWLPLALSKLKPTARAFVFVGAYPTELRAYLNAVLPTQVLVWTYRNCIGPKSNHDYNLNWQAILYYRNPKAPPLTCDSLIEQFAVQQVNAPDGRQAERFFAWQKPDALADLFIHHCETARGCLIDPFAGSGTFLLAAKRAGWRGLGAEKDESARAIAQARGCEIMA